MRSCALALAAVCFFFCAPAAAEAKEEPALYATAAVLLDADTGRVLYGKNSDVFLSNASTTKILTCILALENALPEEIVEASAYAAGMPKVKLNMNSGEHFRLEDLLYSMMLESHNDSAMAIAEHVGGSMEGFAEMMNRKAKEIGCSNTWFITPNGLDAAQTATDAFGNVTELSHGTTARDLALIMAYCAFYSPKREEFLKITRTDSYFFASGEGRSFSCTNHNAFLHMMDGALTGKTGFTNKAGYCYVGALERDGKRFVVALLACGWPNHKSWKWADAKALFSYGLSHYEYHRLDETAPDERVFEPIPVANGQTFRLEETAYVQVGEGKRRELCGGMAVLFGEAGADGLEGMLLAPEEKIEVVCEVQQSLTAPVEAGRVVGCIRYLLGDETLAETDIVTLSDVPAIDLRWCFLRVLEKYVL